VPTPEKYKKERACSSGPESETGNDDASGNPDRGEQGAQKTMTTSIRASEIERAVKSVLRGGAQVFRVVVDVQERRIIIDTAPAEQGAQAFDSLSFRREAN
jgi:hypothetical protein